MASTRPYATTTSGDKFDEAAEGIRGELERELLELVGGKAVNYTDVAAAPPTDAAPQPQPEGKEDAAAPNVTAAPIRSPRLFSLHNVPNREQSIIRNKCVRFCVAEKILGDALAAVKQFDVAPLRTLPVTAQASIIREVYKCAGAGAAEEARQALGFSGDEWLAADAILASRVGITMKDFMSLRNLCIYEARLGSLKGEDVIAAALLSAASLILLDQKALSRIHAKVKAIAGSDAAQHAAKALMLTPSNPM